MAFVNTFAQLLEFFRFYLLQQDIFLYSFKLQNETFSTIFKHYDSFFFVSFSHIGVLYKLRLWQSYDSKEIVACKMQLEKKTFDNT